MICLQQKNSTETFFFQTSIELRRRRGSESETKNSFLNPNATTYSTSFVDMGPPHTSSNSSVARDRSQEFGSIVLALQGRRIGFDK